MDYHFVPATGGQVPPGAQPHGREGDGTQLFVARANFSGGVHPGKIRFDFHGAFISFNGKEVLVPNYEVLVSPVERA